MYFSKLNRKTCIENELNDFLKESHEWKIASNFPCINVPINLVDSDSTIRYFISKFDAHAIILHMKPNSFYRFHRDATRSCAVNMLISGFDSCCYYGNDTEYEYVTNNITELKYEKNEYYLLNTKEKHAILNRNNERYLFSLCIYNYNFVDVLNAYQLDHS